MGPALTVETEREKRRTAEELRQALEAIHRPTRLDEALEEVLTQLGSSPRAGPRASRPGPS
jgi:hypothetical protein